MPRRRTRKKSQFSFPPPDPLPENVHWVESDSYDRAVYEQLRAASPSLQRLEESGAPLLPHFRALLRDLFCALFKYNIVFFKADDVLPSAAVNREFLTAFHPLGGQGGMKEKTGELANLLREATVLDEGQAGLATVLLGEGALRLLKSEKTLTRRDLLDVWNVEKQEALVQERIDEAQNAKELAQQADAAEDVSQDAKEILEHTAERMASQARAENTRLQRLAKQLNQDLSRVQQETRNRFLKEAITVAQNLDDATQEAEAWGLAVGGGHQSSPGRQIELGKRLAGNDKLKKLAAMVGRMKHHALALRRKNFERTNDEVFEVGLGAELSRLLPHELLSLQHPVLRQDFIRRFVDNELLQYDLRGVEAQGKGPLIVCLDGSSSMQGDKEVWAKALTLTLLEVARRERRRFRAICFSSADAPLYSVDLNTRVRYEADMDKVLELAEYFPGGGTDFEKPLDAALGCIKEGTCPASVRQGRTRSLFQESRFQRGDIVFITDGECRVHADWAERFATEKNALGCSLFSILIDIGTEEETCPPPHQQGGTRFLFSSLGSLTPFSDKITTVSQLTSTEARDVFVKL